MSQSSSGDHRNRSDGPRSGGSSSSRNRNRNRGGNRSGGRRSRRPEPKLTGFQKFLKAISFGLIDPARSAKEATSRSGKGRAGDGKSNRKPRRKPEAVEPTSPRLYVGNLNYDVTDEQLAEVFAPVGSVKEAAVVRHGNSGRSKGFAFVEMSSIDEAKAAVSKLNDQDLMGRQMLVTGAKADKPRREGSEKRDSGKGERRERSRERSGERSGDRRPRGGERRERSGGRERKGRGDRIEKPSRQVKPLEIETVSSPQLLVANVNADATDEDFNDLFHGIGSVVSRNEIDRKEGAATADFQVEFSSVEEAQKAVELLHGKSFMGNQLRITGNGGGAPKPAEAEEEQTAAEPAMEESAAEPAEAPAEEPAGEPVEESVEDAAPVPAAEEAGETAEADSSTESTGEWSPSEDDEKNQG